jgi:hypothetical protein
VIDQAIFIKTGRAVDPLRFLLGFGMRMSPDCYNQGEVFTAKHILE